MECTKCQGLMVKGRFFEDVNFCDIWKCLNCGAMVDPTILENQRRHRPFAVPQERPVAANGG